MFRLPFLLTLAGSVPQAQVAELAKLVASDGEAQEAFGEAVALSGDRALVGTWYDSDLGTWSGAAYVYERSPVGAWLQVAKLRASDGAAFDGFGKSVAIDGDRALIGAFGKSNSAGAAYVFERDSSGLWNEVVQLAASDGATNDQFGNAVALAGDRALLGAHNDDDLGSNSGSAYVFERGAGGVWTQAAKLVAADGSPGDWFGYSVSLSGERALVGAPLDDLLFGAIDAGSAYVFRQAAGAWSQVAKLVPSTLGPEDRFGASVSLSGARAIVGADTFIGGGPYAAYLFELPPGGQWSQVAALVGGSTVLPAVSIFGDRALVGAGYGSASAYPGGEAYLLERSPAGAWTIVATLAASDGAVLDLFGAAVSLSGDRALVGALSADAVALNSGAAYVFDSQPLSSGVAQVSVSTGGVQPLALDAGHVHAGELHLLLGSASGTAPGIPLGAGLFLPLVQDAYLMHTLTSPHTPPLANSLGFLGAAGSASASFVLPAGSDPTLAGITVNHAFLALQLAPLALTFASNALPVALVP